MSHVEQIRSRWHPKCTICGESVEIEESKTDEYGQAVHELCYVSNLVAKKKPPQPFRITAKSVSRIEPLFYTLQP